MSTSLHAQPRLQAKGFTLIEVMIVVAIIGILASVAYPSYTDYVRRGQVTEAFTQLSTWRTKMEQYYQDNRNYGTDGVCAADASANSWNGFAATEHFTYACATTDSDQKFTITATGSSGAAKGNDFSIDHEGKPKTSKFKGSDVSPVAECWFSKEAAC